MRKIECDGCGIEFPEEEQYVELSAQTVVPPEPRGQGERPRPLCYAHKASQLCLKCWIVQRPAFPKALQALAFGPPVDLDKETPDEQHDDM